MRSADLVSPISTACPLVSSTVNCILDLGVSILERPAASPSSTVNCILDSGVDAVAIVFIVIVDPAADAIVVVDIVIISVNFLILFVVIGVVVVDGDRFSVLRRKKVSKNAFLNLAPKME